MPILAVSAADASRIVEALRGHAAAKIATAHEAPQPLYVQRDADYMLQLARDVERSVTLQLNPTVERPPCRCDQAPGQCVLHGVGAQR